MSGQEVNSLFRIVFAGAVGAGKSSIMLTMVNGTFPETIPSNMNDQSEYKDDNNNQFTLNATAGQEVDTTITSSYYRYCHGVFLVYSVDNEEYASDVEGYLNDIEAYSTKKVPVFLLLNKMDMDGDKDKFIKFGETFAKKKKMKFYKVSAKNNEGIQEAFADMRKLLLSDDNKKQKKGGCVLL